MAIQLAISTSWSVQAKTSGFSSHRMAVTTRHCYRRQQERPISPSVDIGNIGNMRGLLQHTRITMMWVNPRYTSSGCELVKCHQTSWLSSRMMKYVGEIGLRRAMEWDQTCETGKPRVTNHYRNRLRGRAVVFDRNVSPPLIWVDIHQWSSELNQTLGAGVPGHVGCACSICWPDAKVQIHLESILSTALLWNYIGRRAV